MKANVDILKTCSIGTKISMKNKKKIISKGLLKISSNFDLQKSITTIQ
jgi:hypothetical protein